MLRQAQTRYGTLRGAPCGDPRVTVFKGVPYAKPPVGALRWRLPQPVEPWDGVRMADRFPPIGWQDQPGVDAGDFWTRELNPAADECVLSEDCLYLNIWTPAKAADEKLPVFLWIHGGGLESGYSWEMEFDGERMARQGVIFITIGYRLNVFGLFCHRELAEPGNEGGANFCFHDMIAGLKWIRENIAAFGGDPQRVTVGGQSGGALAVLGMITSPQTRDLISGAIAQSGGGLRAFGYGPLTSTVEAGQRKGDAFLKALGCATIDEARRLDPETLYRAFRSFTREHGRMDPIVDHVVFDEDINDAMMENHHHPIPILFGSNTGEGPGGQAAPPAPRSMAEFEQLARQTYGERAEEFLALCGANDMADVRRLMKRDAFNIRTIPVRAYARVQAAQGRSGYFYLFDAPIPGDDAGAFHGSEMWFVFNSLNRCWRPFTGMHYDLAFTLSGYWVNFVRHGDPNGKDMLGRELPVWGAYTQEDPFYLRITDRPARDEALEDPLTEFRIAFHLKNYADGKPYRAINMFDVSIKEENHE